MRGLEFSINKIMFEGKASAPNPRNELQLVKKEEKEEKGMLIEIVNFSEEHFNEVSDILLTYAKAKDPVTDEQWTDLAEVSNYIERMYSSLEEIPQANDKVKYYVALDQNKKVLGIIGRKKEEKTNHKNESVELINFYVDKNYVGNRIGSTLLNHLEEEVIQEGHKRIFLFSSTRYQNAWGFYKQHGFNIYAEREAIEGQLAGMYFEKNLPNSM